MTTPRTLVALATYNEIENLPGLVDAILRVLPDAESARRRRQFARRQRALVRRTGCDRSRGLRCVHRAGKLGLGSATLDAIRYAIARDYDVVVTMDADWSHDPVHLPELVAATEHADVAIGSRYVAGGAIDGWPWHRRILSRAINGLSRALLQLPIHDTSGAFRAYRVATLASKSISTKFVRPATPTWRKSSGIFHVSTPRFPKCQSRSMIAAPDARRSISARRQGKS